MRRALTAMALVCLLAATQRAHADDRTTLLTALRPSVRGNLPELGPLSDLPLYDLTLTLRDDLAGYSLREVIEFTNTTGGPLPDIVLRLFGNHGAGDGRGSQPAPIRVESSKCLEQLCKITQPRPSVLKLQPATALPPGAHLRIVLQMTGQLRAIDTTRTDFRAQGLEGVRSLLAGEQASDYGLLSLGDGIASFAHFYAVLAQRTEQGWRSDEQKPFGDIGASGLSFVRASIVAPRDVTVVSSGVTTGQLAASDVRLRTQRVTAALVRDFAVVASRDFSQRSRQVGDVVVRAHFLARDADGGGRVLDTAAGALAVFERRFGRYPYRALDVVESALVGGAGGCEFSGLVTIASMLYRPLAVSPALLGMLGSPLEFTTAHEVAHQYWYGLVGSDAREHPFQDEALTQWSARLYFEDRFGPQRGEREAEAQIGMNYRVMRMLGHADGVVDRPVDAFDSSLSYAGLVYGKGAYLYPVLRKLLGDEAFFNALRGYVLQYQFQSAPPEALFDRMTEAAARTVKVRALVQRWLAQKHGDQDLGTSANGLAAAVGCNDRGEQRRLTMMLRALMAASPSDGNAQTQPPPAQGSLDGANANAEQLNGVLKQLLGTSGGGESMNVEQLQGMLNGSNAGGDVDARGMQNLLEGLKRSDPGANGEAGPGDLPPELQGEPNQRGL